jgi:hypothetical protein
MHVGMFRFVPFVLIRFAFAFASLVVLRDFAALLAAFLLGFSSSAGSISFLFFVPAFWQPKPCASSFGFDLSQRISSIPLLTALQTPSRRRTSRLRSHGHFCGHPTLLGPLASVFFVLLKPLSKAQQQGNNRRLMRPATK